VAQFARHVLRKQDATKMRCCVHICLHERSAALDMFKSAHLKGDICFALSLSLNGRENDLWSRIAYTSSA